MAKVTRFTSPNFEDVFAYEGGAALTVYVTPSREQFKAGLRDSLGKDTFMDKEEAEFAQNAEVSDYPSIIEDLRENIEKRLGRNGFTLIERK